MRIQPCNSPSSAIEQEWVIFYKCIQLCWTLRQMIVSLLLRYQVSKNCSYSRLLAFCSLLGSVPLMGVLHITENAIPYKEDVLAPQISYSIYITSNMIGNTIQVALCIHNKAFIILLKKTCILKEYTIYHEQIIFSFPTPGKRIKTW